MIISEANIKSAQDIARTVVNEVMSPPERSMGFDHPPEPDFAKMNENVVDVIATTLQRKDDELSAYKMLAEHNFEIAKTKDDQLTEMAKALYRLVSVFSRDGSSCEQINPEQNQVLVSQARAVLSKYKNVNRCACCGTTENLHPDYGSGGPYRCSSPDCLVF